MNRPYIQYNAVFPDLRSCRAAAVSRSATPSAARAHCTLSVTVTCCSRGLADIGRYKAVTTRFSGLTKVLAGAARSSQNDSSPA